MNSKLPVIIILVLIVLMALVLRNGNTNERFNTKNCNFKVTGESKLDCLNKCKANKHCYYYQCEKICGKCEKENTDCHWDKPDVSKGSTKDNKPHPVEISIDTSEGSVKISFKTTRLKLHDIDGYLYQLYKTNNKSDGIIMGTFANKNCITCEKVITNLDPKETYTVSVKPFNNYGVGEESNKINFMPIGKLSSYDFNINTPIEDLFENEYKFCDSN